MIRRFSLVATPMVLGALLWAGAAQAQPYGDQPDPYALPPGYDQVTGYDQPGYAPDYEGPASYDEPEQPGYPPEYEGPAYADAPPAEDYAADRSGDQPRYDPSPRYVEDRGYAAVPPRDDSYYNSGASVRGSSTASRESYARSGERYSSRERSSSAETYVEGPVGDDGRLYEDRRASTGSPVYVDENGYSREGEAYSRDGSAYAEERSGYSARYSAAPFGYQRRFAAFSVAEERSETLSYERSEEYAYRRGDRIAGWANGDLRLDNSFVGGLTGGVEGQGPVMWSGGGGYASFSASAGAFAGARAFAGVRGSRGHRGKGRGGRCGC